MLFWIEKYCNALKISEPQTHQLKESQKVAEIQLDMTLGWLVGWLVGWFYGISTFGRYLMPNPFLNN